MGKSILFFLFISVNSIACCQPMRVLFVGNSYTHYNNMPKLFKDIASSKNINVDVHMSAKSSHTFKMHSERPDLYQDIQREKWDYVILQGFSRELSTDIATIDSMVVPYVKRISDSIYQQNPCATILLYETSLTAWTIPSSVVNSTLSS